MAGVDGAGARHYRARPRGRRDRQGARVRGPESGSESQGARICQSGVCQICGPLGHKVYTIVNYEGCEIARDVEDAYAAMVQAVVDRFYLGVTRFTTSSFMRAKLGEALGRRALAPHIFESEQEAAAGLRGEPD